MPTVYLLDPIAVRHSDPNLSPVSGALLHTYVAGTTTNLATYTDSTGTTAHPNPIVADTTGIFPEIWVTSAAYDLVAKKSDDTTGLWSRLNVTAPSAAVDTFETTLSGSGGSANIGFIQAGTGAVARTLQSKGRDVVNAADFGVSTSNPDNSTALQNFFNACSSDNNDAPEGILPPGIYPFATTIIPARKYLRIRGHGCDASVLQYTGATAAIKPAAMAYFRSSLSDFQIQANSQTTALGVDLSNITSQAYAGAWERLTIYAGSDAVYAPHIFSMKMDTVRVGSGHGHGFRMNCGPGMSFINCYAESAGTGKAGYRLAGEVLLLACNGVDNAERWGVFGSNTSATDGFQSDFPGVTDFPRVHMVNCNVEAFSLCGLMFHNSYRYVNIEGGKFDRSALSTAYESIITITTQGTDVNAPFWLNPSFWNPGSGTPTNGASAYVWVKSGSVCVVEMTGGQIGQVYDSNGGGVGVGALVPTVSLGVIQDILGGRSLYLNALRADRLSLGFNRYITQSYTPVGTSQVIDVTGVGKAVITAVGAGTSISKATFTDASRNGDLYIEATDGNLTVKNGGAADNFKLLGGVDLALYAGQVVHFQRNNAGFWSQV